MPDPRDRGEVVVGQRGDELVLLRRREQPGGHEYLDDFPLSRREAARVRTYLCAWLGHADEQDCQDVLGWKRLPDQPSADSVKLLVGDPPPKE